VRNNNIVLLGLKGVIYKGFICVVFECINRHKPQGKQYVVRREIVRNENNSTRWYLDGKASSLKAVRF